MRLCGNSNQHAQSLQPSSIALIKNVCFSLWKNVNALSGSDCLAVVFAHTHTFSLSHIEKVALRFILKKKKKN